MMQVKSAAQLGFSKHFANGTLGSKFGTRGMGHGWFPPKAAGGFGGVWGGGWFPPKGKALVASNTWV